MAQTKDEKKRIAIRDAAIADVVKYGLGNAPVSRIASHAGVSVGTIYVYYPNKEEMLESIFLEVKSLLHKTMMEAQDEGAQSAERIKAMWFSMFEFFLKSPMKFAFLEAIDAEKLLNKTRLESVAAMARDVNDILQKAMDDETLKPLPMDCLIAMLLGPAVSLSKQMISGGDRDRKNARHVFDAIWAGIANLR